MHAVETARSKPLGRYQLLAELGRGDVGLVYSASVDEPGAGTKAFLVKALWPELAADEGFVRAFFEQMRLAARLDHPNVVQTYEAGEFEGRRFVATEYLEGKTARTTGATARREGRPMPRPLQLRVLSEVLLGLHYAHELRGPDGTLLDIVHRGLAPRTVFLTYDGQVKLVDFGVARALEATGEASAGTIDGRGAYMAPEQVDDASDVDRRADVFAGGVMLWEALVGARLWRGVPRHEMFARLAKGDLPGSPASVARDVPPELDRICATAMAARPEARYPTALAFREAIERYIMASGEGVSTYDIGRFVSALFPRERPARPPLVEPEPSPAGAGSADGGFAVWAPTPGELAQAARPSMRRLTPAGVAPAPSGPPPAAAPPVGPSAAPPVGPSVASSASSASCTVLPAAPSVGPPAAPPASRPAPRHPSSSVALAPRRAILAGAAVVVASATLTTSAILVTRGAPRSVRMAASALPPSPSGRRGAGAAGGPVALLALKIQVSPPHARVFLDGEELPPEARTGVRPRDGRPHRLRAEAEGYQARSQTLRFDQADVAVDLTLDPRTPGPTGPPGREHATSAPAPHRPHRAGPPARPAAAPPK